MKDIFNKKIKFFLIIISLLFFYKTALASDINSKSNNLSSKNPKLANIFLGWSINDQDVIELAKWDVLILDMENQINNPERIKKIRELNPNIIILAYVSSQEIRDDVYLYDNIDLRKKIFENIDESWYLKFDNKKISFWPETWMINSTNYSPVVNKKRWNDYLPEFVASEIISTGLWDGVFYDNLFDSIFWLNNGKIDLDQNGLIDSADFSSEAWRQGNIKILQKTRELIGYNYIILANSSSYPLYHKYLNGRVFENFSNPFEGKDLWIDKIDSYKSIYNINVYPKIYIFNSTENDFSDYDKMRFSLVSSLLFDDVYFSFDKGVSEHSQTWFYDEYNFNFSYPLTIATQNKENGVWQRIFKNFMVILNTNDYQVEIDWPNGWKKIYSQNDGLEEKLILLPKEGLILEPILDINNQVFKNKSEYSAFNFSGKKVYSSYVLSSSDFLENEFILKNELGVFEKAKRKNEVDSNSNGFTERVEGVLSRNKSLVKIFNQNNDLVGIFKAFPDQFNCGVNVAIGDVDGDGKSEIITMPFWGGPHIRIFDFSGNLKYDFFAGDKNFRGFYDILAIDIDNDNKTEIFINNFIK